MDTMAKALLNAAAMIEGGELSDFVEKRYAGWKEDLGQSILKGEQSAENIRTEIRKKIELHNGIKIDSVLKPRRTSL